ncbi:hypothetical protein [Zunongwangia sp. HGR-M22]|uniref:hypothetical protein n=1 Tax=Zunongwangia sp. HGR-M22 TaxID=3015168 RepID=UPI0022DD9D94|nr:hypothetical protein [Zunongwangia sp. HGR-M22]WBL27155.1 hypothetical protein PBT91_07740 [Zunongwangia sp. HGR-M22]
MSFGSSIGAIISLKNNKRKRSSQLARYAKNLGSGLGNLDDYKKLPKEELDKLGQKIKVENNKKRQRVIVLTAIIMIVLICIFWYFMF